MTKLKKGDETIELTTQGAIDAFVSAGWEVVKDDKKDKVVKKDKVSKDDKKD